MPINFNCPKCGKKFRRISDQYAGRKVQCTCGHKTRLPKATDRIRNLCDKPGDDTVPLIRDDFSDLDSLLADDPSPVSKDNSDEANGPARQNRDLLPPSDFEIS